MSCFATKNGDLIYENVTFHTYKNVSKSNVLSKIVMFSRSLEPAFTIGFAT